MQAVVPPAVYRRRAPLLLKLHVEFGQNKKERRCLACPVFRFFAVRQIDPFVDHAGEILDFLIAGADAQEHGGEFPFGGVALKEVGDFAAQEKLLEHPRLFQFPREIVQFVA